MALRPLVHPVTRAPGWSTLDQLVDHLTVMTDVKKAGGEHSPPAQPDRIVGLDGKSYPAKRSKPAAPG